MTGGGGDADPWDFLAKRKEDMAARSTAEPTPAPAEPAASPRPRAERERGELRASMAGPSLRARAAPMAFSLALVSLAGFLTEVVASSQVLAAVGPSVLLLVYPLGGIGLIALALLQFRYIDQKARLPMIRGISLGYAIVFAVAIGLIAGSVIPVVATVLIWLLADQLNFLVPLLIWSLAGDEFNVAEGKKVFGWIVIWTYAGQIAGLVISTATPFVLEPAGVPLWVLLLVNPVVCVFVAWWLPRRMRDSASARGLARDEGLSQSLASAWDFISGVPVWRSFLIASLLTFAAGMTAFLGYLTGVQEVIGQDAGSIQVFIGAVGLVSFLIAWAVQVWGAERLQDRLGIPGVLLVLPIATVVAAAVVAVGAATGSLPLLGLGIAIWFVPRWSIDENARRAALALVPDERRARISFFVDLGPVAVGLIVSGPLALVGVLTGLYWLVPAVAAVVALLAIRPALAVVRGWDESMLNWRLRRRKHNRGLDLGE